MSYQLTSTGIIAAVTNLQNILKALPNLQSDTEAAVIDASKKAAKKQTEESLKAAGISGPIGNKSKCASGQIMGKNGKCVASSGLDGISAFGSAGIENTTACQPGQIMGTNGKCIALADLYSNPPVRGGANHEHRTRKAEKRRKIRKTRKTHQKNM